MKIKELNEVIKLPDDMDVYCINLCNTLNRLPGCETYESCSGHGKHEYWIFFNCTDIDTLSRLGRAVCRNYSDGNWEILVDSCDGDPVGRFWLKTKTIIPISILKESINDLIENILYWFSDDFDDYFSGSVN